MTNLLSQSRLTAILLLYGFDTLPTFTMGRPLLRRKAVSTLKCLHEMSCLSAGTGTAPTFLAHLMIRISFIFLFSSLYISIYMYLYSYIFLSIQAFILLCIYITIYLFIFPWHSSPLSRFLPPSPVSLIFYFFNFLIFLYSNINMYLCD